MNQDPDPDLIQISSLIHDVDRKLLLEANEYARKFHQKWAVIFVVSAVGYALAAAFLVHHTVWKVAWFVLAAVFFGFAVHAYRKSVYYARKT